MTKKNSPSILTFENILQNEIAEFMQRKAAKHGIEHAALCCLKDLDTLLKTELRAARAAGFQCLLC